MEPIDPKSPNTADSENAAQSPNLTPKAKKSWRARLIATFFLACIFGLCGWMWYWDFTPASFHPVLRAKTIAKEKNERMVVGYTSVTAEIDLIRAMLDKRGGYLSNDMLPPGVLMDNVPNWEFGVLSQVRDFARAMRRDFSRSQTQSVEDKDLIEAEPKLSFSNDSWLIPSSESQYRSALLHLENYRVRLTDTDVYDAQFYARADNFARWLALVEGQLGSLSQRLSASVGQVRIDTDLSNTRNAEQSTSAPNSREIKTPWMEIDNVFYEARGSTYALAHLLKAAEYDFASILEDKNARISVQQIIRELEAAQAPIRSPIILNGSQFGFFSNHSLVMANYVSRANAAVIELRQLMERG